MLRQHEISLESSNGETVPWISILEGERKACQSTQLIPISCFHWSKLAAWEFNAPELPGCIIWFFCNYLESYNLKSVVWCFYLSLLVKGTKGMNLIGLKQKNCVNPCRDGRSGKLLRKPEVG